MNLLLKPHWNAKDIAKYVGCGLTKAYEVMKSCRKKYNGTIVDMPSFVKRDSVLAYCGTSVERELYILKERGKTNGSKTL